MRAGETRESPRLATEGEQDTMGRRLSTHILIRRPPAVNYIVVVDDFALNPDIDWPIACFERWPGGAP